MKESTTPRKILVAAIAHVSVLHRTHESYTVRSLAAICEKLENGEPLEPDTSIGVEWNPGVVVINQGSQNQNES